MTHCHRYSRSESQQVEMNKIVNSNRPLIKILCLLNEFKFFLRSRLGSIRVSINPEMGGHSFQALDIGMADLMPYFLTPKWRCSQLLILCPPLDRHLLLRASFQLWNGSGLTDSTFMRRCLGSLAACCAVRHRRLTFLNYFVIKPTYLPVDSVRITIKVVDQIF